MDGIRHVSRENVAVRLNIENRLDGLVTPAPRVI